MVSNEPTISPVIGIKSEDLFDKNRKQNRLIAFYRSYYQADSKSNSKDGYDKFRLELLYGYVSDVSPWNSL